MKVILHIVKKTEWEKAFSTNEFRAPSLSTEGFIHCSLPSQIVAVANANFRNEQGLVLLVIDSEELKSPVQFEDLYGEGQKYPHLYGPLSVQAVKHVIDFIPNSEGVFELPTSLRQLEMHANV